MVFLIVFVFIFGYFMIAMEHPFKIDKAASALLTGVLCWVVLLFGFESMPAFAAEGSASHINVHDFLTDELIKHLGEISGILFFLLGAMTIVELVDVHEGFRVITDRIKTSDRVKLLWIISWVSFFLSAGLDNLTTAIIMCALARKLTTKTENLWLVGGFIIIAANAGGAWSPIGDVTTIMLWIGGQVTTFNIMKAIILPSIVSLLVPLLLATYFLRGKVQAKEESYAEGESHFTTANQRLAMFVFGGMALVSVPFFKAITGYPPFMGILLAVGVLWYITEFMHRGMEVPIEDLRSKYSVAAMLHRIDTPSILFFLGILLAVGALEVSGHLHILSHWLDVQMSGNVYAIDVSIGLLSAIVDNVPLVAAAMGMYDIAHFPPDHDFWELLAYCAGTGGSVLIIGSAAGVAAMGILHIDFIWYVKRISLYALAGYFSGVLMYWMLN